MAYSFIDLVKETLELVKEPLTQKEIWGKAIELNISEKVGSSGKTPWATIGARIYTDIRDNESSDFIQVNKRPSKFYLKKLMDNNISTQDNNIKEKLKNKLNFNERDLHPLLVKFIYSNTHFKCYSKTIFHENSNKKQKGYNQWLHWYRNNIIKC